MMKEEDTMNTFCGEELGKFGFGLMRLPRNDDKTIDTEMTSEMVDRFLAAGLKYFDTAYVYEGSEAAAKKALVDRHPRDSFFLTSKLNANAAKDEADAKNQIYVSLERTGAGYIDFYLLHALSAGNKDKYDAYGLWDYVKELKEKGLVRHYGFSFHDSPELLDELLTEHPDVEFVQLQINYADWEDPTVQSRRCYEVASKHGKPVVVMEPVKGGTLANPPQSVKDIFKAADPKASTASWAIRFAASLENVKIVLSGMSNVEQMEDNLSYMKDFKPLNEEEMKVIAEAQEALKQIEQIPCTACHYCTGGCPMQIDIPQLFKVMNRDLLFGDHEDSRRRYANAVKDGGTAGSCIHCLQCEGECPQHIEITSWLEKIAEAFE